MAIKATYEVTVIDQTDAKDLVTWYQLSTSATKPSKPTTTSASATPTGWTKAEPTYDPSQGTKYLYTCQQLVWGDGTCGWGEVQLSSSYEAAKAAANAAAAASASASAVAGVIGTIDAPYTEVEWVESNGKQYVYLDWKPPIATWGFEADFLVRNTFNTTQAAWRSDTNKNNAGFIFGTRNSPTVNDVEFGTYTSYGYFRNGTSTYSTSGLFKTDKTRQTVSYKGTSLKRGDGTTVTFARSSETTNKPYANMAIFCYHDGLRRSGTGNIRYPSTTRIYSLKFFDGDALEVDLVGALRKSDGVTGLYDKVAGHFYPAPGMTFGDEVGDLGEPDTFERRMAKMNPSLSVNNLGNSRMWRADAPMIDSLEDGQQITVTPEYSVDASVQTTELAGWDDTSNNYQVYLKLTLSDGSETDWIPCWYSPTGRLTKHYGAGMPIRLAYRENACVNSTATATTVALRGWFADPNYVDGNTTYTKYSDTVIAGKNGLKRYTLCMRDDAGNWTSIVNQANNLAVSGKTCYTGGLKLGAVSYHATGAEYAAGANAGVIWESYGGIDFRYSVNGVADAATTALQFRKPVYLVGTIGEDDGLFYLDSTGWWTQTPNDDTKVYVLIGTAYSSYYAIFVAAVNPAYVVRDGELVEITDSRFVDVNAELERQDGVIALKANASNVYTKQETTGLLEVKANKATLTSEINASADTVKIDASRVNITGEAVFSAINNDTGTTKINGGKIDTESITIGQSRVTGLVNDLAAKANVADIPDQMAWYGTCSTDAATAAKVVTCEGFELTTGTSIEILFTTANTKDVPTLNVNNTGDIATWVNNEVTSSTNPIRWTANATLRFVYDGSVWVLADTPPCYSVTCVALAGDKTKVVFLSGAILRTGTTINVRFSNANTYSDTAVRLELYGAGPDAIFRNNEITSASNTLLWEANTVLTFTHTAGSWFLADNGTRTMSEEAAKTATNYITADADGIKIHMVGESTTYQHQTATDTTFYITGKKRTKVGSDGLHIYVDTDESEIASFTSSGAVVGKVAAAHISITNSLIDIFGSDGSTPVLSLSGTTSTSTSAYMSMLGGQGVVHTYQDASGQIHLVLTTGDEVSVNPSYRMAEIKMSDAVESGGTYGAPQIDMTGKVSISDDLTLGTQLGISNGGTGLTSSPSMLVNLGSTSAASVLQATPRPGVTGTLGAAHGGTGQTSLQATRNAMGLGNTTGALPVANGGTGKTTAADARGALGAAARSWTSLGSTTGTSAITFDLKNYYEVCVVARYGTSYLGSIVLPKGALHATTAREIYLGGWGNNSTNSNRRAAAEMTQAKLTPVAVTTDQTDRTASAAWTVYAR